MLKRYIKRLFCDHVFVASYEPPKPNGFSLRIKKEKIVCVKCRKEFLNNYIEVK